MTLPILFDAIRNDDRTTLRTLLKAEPDLANLKDAEGHTAIHVAAEANNPDAIEILLSNRADPQVYFGASGHNALSWALTVGARQALSFATAFNPISSALRASGMSIECGPSLMLMGSFCPMPLVRAVRAGSMGKECPSRLRLTVSAFRTPSTSLAGTANPRQFQSCLSMIRTFLSVRSLVGRLYTGLITAAKAK